MRAVLYRLRSGRLGFAHWEAFAKCKLEVYVGGLSTDAFGWVVFYLVFFFYRVYVI